MGDRHNRHTTRPATPAPPPESAVLFDLDGTLLQTPPLIVAAMIDEAAAVTGTRPDADRTRGLVGLPLTDIALALADGDPQAASQIVTGYRRRYLEHIVPTGRRLLYPGAVETLVALKQAGRLIAIVTNKSHQGAVEILTSSRLMPLIDAIVGADDTPTPKPHPAPVITALRLLDATPNTSAMVGDTATDIRAATSAGTPAIGITHGVGSETELIEAGAALVIHNLTDLPSALLALSPNAPSLTTHGRHRPAAHPSPQHPAPCHHPDPR